MHAHRKAKRRRLSLFWGEVEKTSFRLFIISSFHYFVFSPRKKKRRWSLSLFRGEVEKTKRRKIASFRPFVISTSPRNKEKTKIIVISWRKDDKLRAKNSGAKYFAALISTSFISLFRVVLSLFRYFAAQRRRISLFRGAKTAYVWMGGFCETAFPRVCSRLS